MTVLKRAGLIVLALIVIMLVTIGDPRNNTRNACP